MCKLNPKVDFAFKKLFGSEENKSILIAFINSILDEKNKIDDIELKNPYNISNYKNGKMTILDIKAVDEKGIWYDIEMQIAEQGFYDKRALYYWSKVYSDQLESGYDFTVLRKTIAINILDFNYLKEDDFHNIYKIYNEKTKEEFSDLFEMHFIELTKFKKDYKDLKTSLDRWVSFLNKAYEIEKDKMPKELLEDENIKKAVEKLEIMYLDKEEREIYENDLKALLIHKAEIKTAEEKGEKRGEENKAIEIVLEMLKDGEPIEKIVKYSKLSEKDILELKKKI